MRISDFSNPDYPPARGSKLPGSRHSATSEMFGNLGLTFIVRHPRGRVLPGTRGGSSQEIFGLDWMPQGVRRGSSLPGSHHASSGSPMFGLGQVGGQPWMGALISLGAITCLAAGASLLSKR